MSRAALGHETSRDAWLAEDPLPTDPLPVLQGWLDEAFAARLQPNRVVPS